MKMYLKAVILMALAAQLSSCGWIFGDEGIFRDRSNDYRNAKVEPQLKVPIDMDVDAMDDNYVVPPISDRTTLNDTEFVVPRPDPISTDVSRETVRINILGSQRWILVDGSPGIVWPRLRGFLSLNQLAIHRVDAVNGIIETAWLQPDTGNALKEHYLLRIEQGVQRGTSEVHVLQADITAGESQWPKYSSNPEREQLMIKELAQYLADSAAAASVSMLAQQAIDSSGKVTIEQDSNERPYIKLILPFSRAWAAVGRSLKVSGYTIDDLDRSQQRYYVHYSDKDSEQESGFFSSLFSSSSNDKEQISKGTAYIIQMEQNTENEAIISIKRHNDKEMGKGEAEHLLKIIKRHIS